MRKKKPIDVVKIIGEACKKDLKWDVENVRYEELSDGNVNYLYRIINKETRESVVIKIADTATRVRPDGYISPNRNEYEAEVLKHFSIAVDNAPKKINMIKVPKVILINKQKHYFLMEDIVPAISLKQALMEGVMPENLGFDFAIFIAFSQIPFVKLIFSFAFEDSISFFNLNNDLIQITEDLVFTFPFFDKRNRNIYTKENEEYLKNEITTDKHLRFISAKLLNRFKTYKQSLIHGDLHTGSVLLKFNGNKILDVPSNNMEMFIIDTEFATIAPIAYDIGNLLAHFTFAYVYNTFKPTNKNRKLEIHTYFSKQMKTLLTSFKSMSYEIFRKRITNALYRNDRFIKKYLNNIVNDSWKFAGLEIIRRVVGSSKVPEITSNVENRVEMERVLVKIAKGFMLSVKNSEVLL
ncbi:MAG: phosphotransferase [Treponema sp.]